MKRILSVSWCDLYITVSKVLNFCLNCLFSVTFDFDDGCLNFVVVKRQQRWCLSATKAPQTCVKCYEGWFDQHALETTSSEQSHSSLISQEPFKTSIMGCNTKNSRYLSKNDKKNIVYSSQKRETISCYTIFFWPCISQKIETLISPFPFQLGLFFLSPFCNGGFGVFSFFLFCFVFKPEVLQPSPSIQIAQTFACPQVKYKTNQAWIVRWWYTWLSILLPALINA